MRTPKALIIPSYASPSLKLATETIASILERVTNCRIYRQDAPDSFLLENAHRYKNSDFAETKKKEEEYIKTWETALADVELSFPFFERSPVEARSILLKRIIHMLVFKISFMRLCRKVHAATYGGASSFALLMPLPKFLRQHFSEQGFHAGPSCAILWQIYRIETFLSALKRSGIELIKGWVRFFSSPHLEAKPNVVFVGLGESDFAASSGPETKPGILRFVEERLRGQLGLKGPVFLARAGAVSIQHFGEEGVIIGKNPFLIHTNGRNRIRALFRFSRNQIATFFGIARGFFLGRDCDSFLQKEYAELPWINEWFISEKPKHVLQSFEGQDPLWFCLRSVTGTEAITFFYSINSKLVEFEEPFIDCVMPYFFHMVCDRICAWDMEHVRWLERLGYAPGKITLFGPTLFALPASQINAAVAKPAAKVRQIVVFDITPFGPSKLLKIGYGEIYYSYENIKKFVEDIHLSCLEAFGEKGFVIRLKSKRSKGAGHDERYWEFIDSLKGNPDFEIIEPRVMVHSLLLPETADFVVSIPFSSTSNVARDLKVDACYYDPTGKVVNRFVTEDHASLLRGRRELQSFLERKPPDRRPEADKWGSKEPS